MDQDYLHPDLLLALPGHPLVGNFRTRRKLHHLPDVVLDRNLHLHHPDRRMPPLLRKVRQQEEETPHIHHGQDCRGEEQAEGQESQGGRSQGSRSKGNGG